MALMKREDVIVVGAGIVGLCVALSLLRSGKSVTILERSTPGAGASFGNGGLLSVDTNLPIAMPGMLRHVPSWLKDPMGPVTIRPGYALKVLPWLMKWVRAARMPQVMKAAAALRALHKDSYDGYRKLLGDSLFNELIKISGVMQVWETDEVSLSDRVADSIRDAEGIQYERISGEELGKLFPGLSNTVKKGLLLPRNGYTVSPSRLIANLAEAFVREGGLIKHELVMKFLPQERGMTLLTNLSNHRAPIVVLAAGAFSTTLLKPLGIRIPLETERGYHLDLHNCSLELSMPLMHRGRGFGFTPMEHGMRLSGTIEFAGIHAPPNEQRAAILGQHARILFPSMRWSDETVWMGNRPSFPDSIPAIGPIRSIAGLFMSVGHGHYGMVGAPATGRLLTELILDRTPHIDPAPYDPRRFA